MVLLREGAPCPAEPHLHEGAEVELVRDVDHREVAHVNTNSWSTGARSRTRMASRRSSSGRP